MEDKTRRLLVRPMTLEDMPNVLMINNENFTEPWSEELYL